MAYSTLVSLEQTINQILDHDRYSFSSHEKQQIIYLDKYIISFQVFLENFPEKGKNLEARIRGAATKAEDMIEWFMLEKIQHAHVCTKWIAELRGTKFVYQLQKVRDEMDSIVGEMVEVMKNSITIKDVQSLGASSSSQVADTGKINMVGLNEDLIEIKDLLCGGSPRLQVLPIIGMGGIGKTTLARNAYDDQLIMEHFQIRAWITISQDYSHRRILSDLLDSINKSMAGNSTEQCNSKMEERSKEDNDSEMAEKVYKTLVGRRFLIVMDDLWSTKLLDDVRKLFPDYNNGSRIILTTRLTNVAAYADSSTPHHEMHLLSADQSWNLLQQKLAFPVPRELKNTGMQIARSCGGLPLAIVVVAGLLSNVSKTLTSWQEIARNVTSSLATTDGQIERILSLSYNHLPHHLRSCFLYMGGFPEDHEIKVTYLIRLWIAEGFVKSTVAKILENHAEEYLEDLVNRSLILVTKRSSNGKLKCCRLHDLVREMCIKLSQEEKFLVHISGKNAKKFLKSMKDERRISISHSDLDSFPIFFDSDIHTLLYFQNTLTSFGCFRLLRVLDLLQVRFKSPVNPCQIFKLFHLRYLAFFHKEGQISRAISNLQYLQTLIIQGDLDMKHLPEEIWNMPQLRHLIITRGYSLYLPINGSSLPLENLQTLGEVRDLICSTSILNMIPNLKKLSLSYRWKDRDALFHNLVHLQQLEKLKLILNDNVYGGFNSSNLVAPSSLKKLILIGWGHRWPYLNIVCPLPNLEVLKLIKFDFKKQEWRTTDEDFPQLKVLFIQESNLRQWNVESSHFPRLESLLIYSCLEMSEIPNGVGEIPTLELIEIKSCRESVAESAKIIQEEQQSYGNEALQVRCIHCEKKIRLDIYWLC